MSPYFNRVTIIGVGLLGASLGLALKKRACCGEVCGVGWRAHSLETALKTGAVDRTSMDPASACADADLVVLATPAAQVIPKLEEIRARLASGAVVTDVASTKAAICAAADELFSAPRRFVGSHPMAGSEKFGPEHGHPDFYEGAVCLVEESTTTDPSAVDAVAALWTALGSRVLFLEPGHHDALLARTSHIPHVLSSAIAALAGRQGDIAPMIGNGFRDMTRIAASRPEVWRDICLTNRDAVLAGLVELRQDLDAFASALASDDAGAVEGFFREGNDARKKVVE